MAKITINELEGIFNKCGITDWQFSGNLKSGGQAAVAEVRRKHDGKRGVFRYLHRTTETDIKRFQREVKVLTDPSFKHKNILNILDSSSEEPYWYISELGQSFADYWNDAISKLQSSDEVLELALNHINQLLDALAHLHSQGVVHRDIKPDNIVMVGSAPVLIDFGLAHNEEEERITPLDHAVGNERSSPDQMRNRTDEVFAWFDVYMIAQLFIWMVADKPTKSWRRP